MELKKLIFSKFSIFLMVICVIAGSIYVYESLPASEPEPLFNIENATYPISKTIRYSFLLKNTSDELIKQAKFSTYAPVKQTASQRLQTIEASAEYSIEHDVLGNQVLNFEIINLPPYGSKVITITTTLDLSNRTNKSQETALGDYLVEENFIEVNALPIQTLASRLARSDTAIPISVYNWVSQNIGDSGYVRNDLGAQYALQNKKGDVTEYMYLTTALLRANAIPARGVAGFVANENKVLAATDYHNWTEYYQNGHWHLLDAQKKVMDKENQNYIAFRIFGIKGKHAISQSQRFFSYDSRLSVKMN